MATEETDESSSWTTDHHLIGNTQNRNLILPSSERDDIFALSSETIKAIGFQAENPHERKPALWRSLVRGSGDVALAIDQVATDWQQKESPYLPTKRNQDRAAERLEAVILERIFENVLPDLVLKAALEEVRAHFFRQAMAEAKNPGSSQETSKNHKKIASPPLYYSRHPNSYLREPEREQPQPTTSAVVQFTPSSLVHRIKAGCALAWSVVEESRRPALDSIAAVASIGADRRASSRIARNVERQDVGGPAVDDSRYFWGVIPGGTIATFLLDEFMAEKKSKENGDDAEISKNGEEEKEEAAPHGEEKEETTNGNANEEENDEQEEVEEEEEEEAEDDESETTEKNPYLEPSKDAIIEWLGRKTSKHLSTSDLQRVFPELMLRFQGKKKKNPVPVETCGREALPLLTHIDQKLWTKVVCPLPKDQSAKLVFECITHENSSDVGEWEIGYFARAQFSIRAISKTTNFSAVGETAEDFGRLEKEFKDRKLWETTRFRAIHSGHTIWLNWADAFSEWKQKSIKAFDPSSVEITEEEPGASDDQDGELAKSLATQEEELTTRRRTTRRGGDTSGVFYGNQSNLNIKQLQETVLRIISPKSFSTINELLQLIPDESTDPMRRMRNSLARLVWKRNQASRIVANAEWTDGPMWKRMHSTRLLTSTNSSEDNDDNDMENLLQYITEMHRTELQLRGLVLKNLANVPTPIIACAADEKPNQLGSMDHQFFDNNENIEWERAGHDWIGKDIFRPPVANVVDTQPSPCEWYRVIGYTPSIPVEPEDGTAPPEKPQIGIAKENRAVERRARFQVIPYANAVDSPTSPPLTGQLILTEAQIGAGLKAAEVENSELVDEDDLVEEHPFSGEPGAEISLIPESDDDAVKQISGTVVGWNSVCDDKGRVHHKVLILPNKGQPRQDVFRAFLATSADGVTCTIEGTDELYSVQQFDYHPSSEAFQECRGIIGLLQRHSKAAPFLEPVDPVALNIPTYFSVVKNPMDIKTLSEKLERSEYSTINPKEATGRTPIARMLNGPFRDDLELIFDNAMSFNPEDDWIHQAASSLKKYIVKKIEQITAAAEQSDTKASKKSSVYVDYDSDVDMYQYESDKDDDFVEDSRQSRKRRQAPSKKSGDDAASGALEKVVRLQKVFGDAQGQLRGPLSKVPIASNPFAFSLPPGWTGHRASASVINGQQQDQSHDVAEEEEEDELSALVTLRAQVDEKESTGLRRSTRSHIPETGGSSASAKQQPTELVYTHNLLKKLEETESSPIRNRFEVELACERLHEEYYAKLYQSYAKHIASSSEEDKEAYVGLFSESCFPPYLGRFTPSAPTSFKGDVVWEIRPANVIPAIRWIIRGLLASGHLSELEPLTSDSLQSGVILANNAYFIDPSAEPFDILHQKEVQRQKRAKQESEESEEEVEMSEYEKRRAERVARNADRLKLLGLA